jgi:hypothetical protein
VNTDELEHQLYRAERRVREIQTKLHRWATDAPNGACGEPDARPTGTSGSGGDPDFARSSAELKGLRQELRDVWACLGVCVLGFVVNPGGVVRWG